MLGSAGVTEVDADYDTSVAKHTEEDDQEERISDAGDPRIQFKEWSLQNPAKDRWSRLRHITKTHRQCHLKQSRE